MSDQLAQAGIRAFEGFDPAQLDPPRIKSLLAMLVCPEAMPPLNTFLNATLATLPVPNG